MAKYWQNPPWDKKEIRRREEKFPHLRKAKDYKDNCQHKHRFNKAYRKEFDTTNPYQYYSTVEKYMDDFGIYKTMRALVKEGYFSIDYIGRRRIIPSAEVEEELFRREMCTFRDWVIWDNDKCREFAKRRVAASKRRTKRFFLTAPGRKHKLFFGKFDTRNVKLARDVANFLLSNNFIFDENSEYYLTDKQIRSFVREKCGTHAFEKLDFKDYILSLKAKSSKKDK